MPITRSKASQLLNQREMALYDDSRINGLRRLDAKALATRVSRARDARDRARDLVRRQKLASRSNTGSKRGRGGSDNQRSKDKAELMADILSRFEDRLREVKREDARAARAGTARTKAGKAATTKSATKKATAARKSAKTATGKVAKQASGKAAKTTARQATKQSATRAATSATRRAAADDVRAGTRSAPAEPAATAGRTASPARRARSTDDRIQDDADSSTRGAARRGRTRAAADRAPTRAAARDESSAPHRARKRKLTPEQALAQTRALLEAKQARDAEPKPWSDTATDGAADGSVGYQSPAAARRAKRLHAAEIRLPANQGSISTRDRVNQGKRDRRNQGGD